MSAYKDMLIGIQELVWSAVEMGMRDEHTIFQFVQLNEPRASLREVHEVLEEIHRESYEEFIWY